MAASLRDIRRKIKSIQGTKKLTQAMQMVAASKMQKAIKGAENTRSYSALSWEIIKNISSGVDISAHPLLAKREKNKIVAILITSNRGLCGALNAQIIKKFVTFLREKEGKNYGIDIITVGLKGKNFISRYYPKMLVADFPSPEKIQYSDITGISKMVMGDYASGKYDRVNVFYNHFVSALRQEPVRRQILPIPSLDEVEEYQLGKTDKIQTNPSDQKKTTEYKFEPDTKSILDNLLPMVIEAQIYQIFLESFASEQSARMMAMKNATDNASDLVDDLTLTYNSLRQAAITREISEISAGAEALRS